MVLDRIIDDGLSVVYISVDIALAQCCESSSLIRSSRTVQQEASTRPQIKAMTSSNWSGQVRFIIIIKRGFEWSDIVAMSARIPGRGSCKPSWMRCGRCIDMV